MFIKSFVNLFVFVASTFFDSSFNLFQQLHVLPLFETVFLFKIISLSSKYVFFTKTTISFLPAHFAGANLVAKVSAVNLLNSWVVIYWWLLLEWLLLGWLFLGLLLLVGGYFDGFQQVKINGHFTDFRQVKNWSYSKTLLGKTGYLSNFLCYLSTSPTLHPGFSDLWRFPPALQSIPTTFGCLFSWLFSHPVFWFTPLSQHSHLGYLWLPTSHCLAPVLLTGHHAIPVITKCFPPNPYLGKQRISLVVATILSICLWLDT